MKWKWHLYRVEWEDTAGRDGWIEMDRMHTGESHTCYIVSVGYLVRRTKDEIVLTQSYDDAQKKVDHTIGIPLGCVRKIRRLKDA